MIALFIVSFMPVFEFFWYGKYYYILEWVNEWEFIILSSIPPALNDNTTTQQLLLSTFQ